MRKPLREQGLYDPAFEHDACGVAFIVDVKGRKSNEIIRQSLAILRNLAHRGATGSEINTGDGAGLLMQIPDKFLRKACEAERFKIPEAGRYGVGSVFLPKSPDQANECEQIFESIVHEEDAVVLGWRPVPNDLSSVGPTAREGAPQFRQVFIGGFDDSLDAMGMERRLYVIRKRAEHAIRESGMRDRDEFFIPSLSSRTLIYKGMLTAKQLEDAFPDLRDPDMESGLVLIHSRFSTNTFPSWPLAHPYRYLAHNGEINTLRGNINWMRAREALCESPHLPDLEKILPIIVEGGSDSAILDNVLEFLYMASRELPHAVLMMIPEPWMGHESMSEERKAFYEFHASLMEPWDGPACIAFTDGSVIGAALDRNGLRPARYYLTRDDLLVMASEVGVLDIPPEKVKLKERLHPGRILLVDTGEGRIVEDEEIKSRYASEHPYREWLDAHLLSLDALPDAPVLPEPDRRSILERQKIFGYTQEDLRFFIGPMAREKNDPTGSMGNDAALAVLSNRPRLLYDYFKQLFAQVTNPPIDAIREELITQISSTIGPEKNLLRPGPESCRRVRLDSPILGSADFHKLVHVEQPDLKAVTLPILFWAKDGPGGLRQAMDDLCRKASRAIEQGYSFIVLSDRGVSEEYAPIPALLATAGVHHHLVREGTRTRVALLVETGEARQVHHMCLLLGFGAAAINPYLVFETIDDMIESGLLPNVERESARENCIAALNKGILKVMSKMGISTIQSYRGAQIFEAIGLKRDFVKKYFTRTASRIGGIGIDVVAEETLRRLKSAFPDRPAGSLELEGGGDIQWRRDGEFHLFNPETVFKLQHATMSGRYEIFKEYAEKVDSQNRHLATLRGLLDFRWAESAVPLEEVEPVEAILKRFSTGGMSYGALSAEAHEVLAVALNRIGGKSNSGEGGEDSDRYVPDSNGDLRRSAVHQVASGRFGVTSDYLVNCTDLQIKMAQGAKPGEGGQLPGHKVYPWIARTRHSTPGVGLISPPPHHDIYSIEDLAQLIYDLKNANPRANVHVKLVSEVGVGTVAAGVAKARADTILISGHDGGTGASPLTSILHAGTPWELGLAETQQVLVLNRLRGRIALQVDGQIKTGRDVVVGALLGADEFGFSTAPLVVMGCIMMRVCHLNTCPVGVASQDPKLREKFEGKPEFVENFFRFVAEEAREYMARLGFRSMDEMIGRVDRLDARKAVNHWKAKGLDFSAILHKPDAGPGAAIRQITAQDHGLDRSLDVRELLPRCRDAIETGTPVSFELPIRNIHRTVGVVTGSEITRRRGAEGLPEDSIRIRFTGSAGQSFGAFIPRGMTLALEGDANDYAGKGLSGGKIVVYPPKEAGFRPEENILIGNVALFGATSGEAYFRGVAGERFCVRNSGAHAVAEGAGDHGCEYMTGGRVVILGKTGRNFAAGMSGGVAYVWDEEGDFERRCNAEMVDIEPLRAPDDVEEVKGLIRRHLEYTGSARARAVLDAWEEHQPRFAKVMPRDYRRALAAIEEAKERGVPWEEAVMEGAHG